LPASSWLSSRADGSIQSRAGLAVKTITNHLNLAHGVFRFALALLAALQGGLLLTQVKRDTKPLEAALDAMIELVARLNGGS